MGPAGLVAGLNGNASSKRQCHKNGHALRHVVPQCMPIKKISPPLGGEWPGVGLNVQVLNPICT